MRARCVIDVVLRLDPQAWAATLGATIERSAFISLRRSTSSKAASSPLLLPWPSAFLITTRLTSRPGLSDPNAALFNTLHEFLK